MQNEEKLTVSFHAYDKQFLLDLSMNSLLLPTHYFEKYHENGSHHIIHSPMKEVSYVTFDIIKNLSLL